LPDIQQILSKAGVNAETLDRVRLAQGVVGKSSYVAGAALLALTVVAFNLHESAYLITVGCVVLALFIIFFGGVLWFAHNHPGESLLEGAELIKWRQMEMAAKEITDLQRAEKSASQLLGESGRE